jgi:uncharacterized protein with PIN domain
METIKTEAKELICLACNEKMVLGKVEVNYLDYIYPVELMTCPKCGQVYISEEVQKKMLSVEDTLEEK